MRYIHTGLICSSETHADHFYSELLGLEKLNAKTLPLELSRRLFRRDGNLQMINYANDAIHFEVFISTVRDLATDPVTHTCIAVRNRRDLVERCRTAGVDVIEVPKEEGMLVFIKDFDGNLFEVKEDSMPLT